MVEGSEIVCPPSRFGLLEEEATEKESSEIDTIQLQLKITCSRNPASSKDSSDPQELYLNHMGKGGDPAGVLYLHL